MGYYDQHYRTPRKRNRWLPSLVIGILVGAFLVLIIGPELLVRDARQEGMKDGGEAEIQTDGGIMRTSVNVDVSTQITEVVELVTPAVVGITNYQRGTGFWQEQGNVEAGTGSGVIYKVQDGTAFVVTNHHVIEGADTVEVVLSDETHVQAEIIGSDLFTDLAVLTMDGSQVDGVIDIGSSANIKVGEPAIAIGNPLGLYLSSTVTTGVISGTERTIPQDFNQDGRPDWQAEVIQTDAAINPGNSGGALINIYGQLIGINSMKINEEAVEGIGFAIPIDFALPVIEELEATGEVVRPYLGVEIYSLDEVPQAEWQDTLDLPADVTEGVYIWTVEALSPADRAGLKRLDVITELDGQPVSDMIGLRKVLYQEKEVGDDLRVTYYRGGVRQETVITLEKQ